MPKCRVRPAGVRAAALSCLRLCAAIAITGVAGIGENCTVVDKRGIPGASVYQGTCMEVKDCTWGSAAGCCHGVNENLPQVQCCVYAPCTAKDGTSGTCKSTDKTFGEQCQGGRFDGAPAAACPFNKQHADLATFQCCVYPTGAVPNHSSGVACAL
jgi:hypothetical protein